MEDKWYGTCSFCGYESDSAFAESEIERIKQNMLPYTQSTREVYAKIPKNSLCICDECSHYIGGVMTRNLHQIRATLIQTGVIECDICEEVGEFLYYTVVPFETLTLVQRLT